MKNNPEKISLFIAGAPKAGTTSLKYYLAQHPQICTHKLPEMTYFYDKRLFDLGYEYSFHRFFTNIRDDQILLAKHISVMYSLDAIQRLYAHNPNGILIILLRNPVERAYSAYWFARQMGWEKLDTFEEAVWSDPQRFKDPVVRKMCGYLEDGLYAKYLKGILGVFPREQVLIFSLDNFQKDPQRVCSTIFGKSKLPAFEVTTNVRYNQAAAARYPALARTISEPSRFVELKKFSRILLPVRFRDWAVANFFKKANKRPISIPPLSMETRQSLIEYFKPYNMDLSSLLGMEWPDWNNWAKT
jgi:hypothetical protein